jgi:hypothetical protein
MATIVDSIVISILSYEIADVLEARTASIYLVTYELST